MRVDTCRRQGVAAVLVAAMACAWPVGALAQVNCNAGIEFYPEGGVKGCNLNGNHTLYTESGDVLVCADGERLEQYPDGTLRSCAIRETQRIGTVRCEAPARVELARDGALAACRRI